MEPVYLKTSQQGTLDQKIAQAWELLRSCTVCPRNCKVDRLNGELGYCQIDSSLVVSSHGPHFGEEAPLVGRHGSGTIFFTSCNLLCVFCQNYDISHLRQGKRCSTEQVAQMMLGLQEGGCHNINFVTPTHQLSQILKAVKRAIQDGLRVPIVYNTGGYDSLEVIKLLEGIVDIYMPDVKFLTPELSKKYCNAEDYPEVIKEAVREMQRQVGDLVITEEGIAQRGLLIRHLVMPGQLKDTQKIVDFLHDEISPNVYLNVMAQYRPCGELEKFPELMQSLSHSEYEKALQYAEKKGMKRLDAYFPRRRHILWF